MSALYTIEFFFLKKKAITYNLGFLFFFFNVEMPIVRALSGIIYFRIDRMFSAYS